MPTIKRKVEMNLVGLLEWAWENEIKNKDFESSNTNRAGIAEVSFDDDGDFNSDYYVSKDEYFTVEIEEEITENTTLPVLFELIKFDNESCIIYNNHNKTIAKAMSNDSLAFYTINDDKSMLLIWTKEKGLVD